MTTETIERPSTAVAAAPLADLVAPELTTLSPETYTAAVFQPFKDKRQSIIDNLRTIDYDIKTTAGMKTAVACRADARDLIVAAEKERKERKAPILAIGKLLDSGYADVEATLLPLRTMFDEEIKAEEKRKEEVAAEKQRVELARAHAITSAINDLRQFETDANRTAKTAAETQKLLDQLEARGITEALYHERMAEAEQVKAEALAAIRTIVATRAQTEAAEAQARAHREAEEQRIAEDRRRLAIELEAVAKLRAEAAETARLAQLERERVASEAVAKDIERERVNAETKRQIEAQQADIARRHKDLAEREAAAEVRSGSQTLPGGEPADDALPVAVLLSPRLDIAGDRFEVDVPGWGGGQAQHVADEAGTTAAPVASSSDIEISSIADANAYPVLAMDDVAAVAVKAVREHFNLTAHQAAWHLSEIDFGTYKFSGEEE